MFGQVLNCFMRTPFELHKCILANRRPPRRVWMAAMGAIVSVQLTLTAAKPDRNARAKRRAQSR